MINAEISAADLRITITDDIGVLENAVRTGTGSRGDLLEISFQGNEEADYLVKVELASDSTYSFGSYALVALFRQNLNESTLDDIREVIRRNYDFVEQDQIQELFCQDEPLCDGLVDLGLNDEFKGPINDTIESATVLEPLVGFEEENRYRVQASLQSNFFDVDFYRVTSPQDCTNLTVSLTAFGAGGPIADIVLFDQAQCEISGRIFVNGNGELLVQFTNISENTEYFIRVQADNPKVFGSGNYQLDVDFCTPNIRMRNLASGLLTTVDSVGKHSLYVARSQLFHFALQNNLIGDPIELENGNPTIWMSVIDEKGDVVHRIATRVGEIRSSRSVVLRPGSYAIRVNYSRPMDSNQRRFNRIQYVIEGDGVSEPTGPEIIDSADDPFAPCDKLSNEFCYPDNVMSLQPFIIVDGEGFKPPVTPVDPPWEDSNIWYWIDDWLG